jgi:hypothetical protein
LGAAEQQEAENSGLVATEVEDGADAVFILGDAGITDRGDESEVFERMEGLSNLFFCQIENWVSTRALVTGVDQRIERQGIIFGRGDLFFDQRAEDAELDGIKMHI